MSAKANYFKIGVFILSALVIAVLAIVVLSKGQWFKHFLYWETYFDESVQGLAVGSPVKYRGVQIGTVDAIEFVRDVYGPELGKEDLLRYGRYVLVRGTATEGPRLTEEEKQLERGGMITAGLRVRLASQGLTGLVYLEADYLDPKEYPALEVPWKPRTAYLPSAPSTVSILGAAVQNIARDLEKADIYKVAGDLDSLVLEVTNAVKEANIPALSSQAGRVLAEFQGTAQQIRRVVESREFNSIISDAARTVEGTKDFVAELAPAAARLERNVRRIDTLLANKSQDIEETLENLRAVSQNLRELTDHAKRYPAQVFLGEPPPRAGSTKR